MYYNLLTELALNRFRWQGLPPTVSERWLECCLTSYGCAVFFRDDRAGIFLATQTSYSGSINVYNNPTRFQPVGTNYHYKTLKAGSECVPIWDNRSRVTFGDILRRYARRLANIDKAYDVNLESFKLPTLVTADQRTKLSVQNMLQQHEEGQPYIIAYESADPYSIFQPWPNPTQYLLDKFIQQKAQVTNEVLSYLGIQSSGTEKKERLIADEVSSANEKTDMFRLGFLNARQEAAREINRLWPELCVSVRYADTQSGGVPNALETDSEDGGNDAEF